MYMAYIEKISYHLNRRDEVPNQELAKLLADGNNLEGVMEIGAYLNDKNKSIASDCLKVLYEVGYIKPELIVSFTADFLEMLQSKNNRMVWGSMIGLANIAKVSPDEIFKHRALIMDKIQTGTVITNVWGVYTIINMAANGYYEALKADLFELQKTCRPVDFAKRAESILPVIQDEDKAAFIEILTDRLPSLTASAGKRLQSVINKYQ